MARPARRSPRSRRLSPPTTSSSSPQARATHLHCVRFSCRDGATHLGVPDPGIGSGGARHGARRHAGRERGGRQDHRSCDRLRLAPPGAGLSGDPVGDDVTRRLESRVARRALFVPSSSIHVLRPTDGSSLGAPIQADLRPDFRAWTSAVGLCRGKSGLIGPTGRRPRSLSSTAAADRAVRRQPVFSAGIGLEALVLFPGRRTRGSTSDHVHALSAPAVGHARRKRRMHRVWVGSPHVTSRIRCQPERGSRGRYEVMGGKSALAAWVACTARSSNPLGTPVCVKTLHTEEPQTRSSLSA